MVETIEKTKRSRGRPRLLNDKQRDVIKEKYPRTSTSELAEEMGITIEAIYREVKRLGIKKDKDFCVVNGLYNRGGNYGKRKPWARDSKIKDKVVYEDGYWKVHERKSNDRSEFLVTKRKTLCYNASSLKSAIEFIDRKKGVR